MTKVGSSSGGGLPTPVDTSRTDEAKAEQTSDQIKDIQKKTTQVVTQRKEIADGVDQKRDPGLAGARDPEKQKKAQNKLDAEYTSDPRRIIEDAFKTRVDPEVAQKLQKQLQSDPKFTSAVEDLRDVVAEMAKAVLKEQAKKAPEKPGLRLTAEPPKTDAKKADLKPDTKPVDPSAKPTATPTDTKSTDVANQDAKAGQPAKDLPPNKDAKPSIPAPPAKDAKDAKPTDAKDAKPTDAAKDAKPADAAKDAKPADAAKDAKPTDDTKQAEAAKDAKATDGSKDAKPSDAAKDAKAAEASKDAKAATDAKDAKEPKPVEGTTPDAKAGDAGEKKTKEGVFEDYPEGEVGSETKDGQLIVEKEFYDQADAGFAAAGMDAEFMASFRMLGVQAEMPFDPTSVGGDTMGLRSMSGGAGEISDGSVGGLRDTGGGGASPPMDFSGYAEKVTAGIYAVLGSFNSGDVGEIAFMLLAETIKDVSKDMRAAQQAMRMRHKINDAMRKEFADFLQATASLTPGSPKDPEDIKKIDWVYREPFPVYDAEGNIVDVEMREVQRTNTFTGVSLPPVSGKEETAVTHSAEWVANQYVDGKYRQEPSGPTADGGYEVTSSHFKVSFNTAEGHREAYRTKLKAMKQDMEKETLNVQKYMGIRKQVLENLTKIIKNRADEWNKSIAAMRR